MNSQSNPENRSLTFEQISGLVSALCDGSITSDDLRVLEKELLHSSIARVIYTSYLEHEASLEWELASEEALSQIRHDELEEYLLLTNSTALDAGKVTQSQVASLPKQFTNWFLTLAAILIVGLTIWGVYPKAKSPDLHSSSHLADSDEVVGIIEKISDEGMWYIEDLAGSEHPKVAVGETLRVVEGEVEIIYNQGVTVALAAPAVFEFTNSASGRLIRGKLRGHVPKGAEGFVIDTPRAAVIDHGTSFGISVDETGSTDVAVFEGEVAVESAGSQSSLRLKMGDGVRLDKYGQMSRLISFESNHFPSEGRTQRVTREPVIVDIRDNTNQSEFLKYYEIVVGGLREDARAFVDREFHQWNGHTEAGMPEYLHGADYVRMFNNDKMNENIEIEVTIGQPAILYVFVDDRNRIPDWLSVGFEDTGDNIGLDTGPFTNWNNELILEDHTTGIGPGESIDGVFSIWRLTIRESRTLTLGRADTPNDRTNMYALAAVPLE